MAEPLSIRVLGGFQVTFGKLSPEKFNSPRIQTLIAYLTLHPERPVARQEIAYLFWPDSNDNQARTNFRQLLFRLRQYWPDALSYLDIQETYLQWKETGLIWADVWAFWDELAAAEKSFSIPEKQEHLSKAASLYQGDLFPACYEDWITPFRLKLHQSILAIIEELISLLEAEKDYSKAIAYADQLRKTDSFHEPAYQHLMRLHSLTGNRGKALQVFHELTTILKDEFAAEPSEETQALYEGLQTTMLKLSSGDRTSAVFPLFGRETEWQAIRKLWQALKTGSLLFVLKGEAGIGKTKLAEEFHSWVSHLGYRSALTRCYPGEIATAYAPVTGWLREIKTQTGFRAKDPLWLQEISRIYPELLIDHPTIQPLGPLTESWQRQKFYEALCRGIIPDSRQYKSRLQGSRLVLILDDLQWCDMETLDWIEYLMRFDPSRSIFVFATYRDEDIEEREYINLFLKRLEYAQKKSELVLGGLDQVGVSTLASHILNHPLDEAQASKMLAETDGNPLFVLEMAQAWKQGSLILPVKLQGIIETRLGKLSASARELADQAAVVGKELDIHILIETSHLPEEQVVQSLDELLKCRLLREQSDGTLDFAHAKVRDAVYQDISVTRRQFLHRRVAKSLIFLAERVGTGSEQMIDLQASQIARHFADGNEPYQAFLYYFRAANYSAGIFAYREAERLYSQAIQMAQKIKWSGNILAQCFISRGRMLEHLGRFIEAVGVYEELQNLAEERNKPEMQCLAMTRLVACFIEPSMVHNLDQADRMIAKGLKLARIIGAYEQEAQLLWSQLVKATHYGDPEEAQQAGQACVEVARAHGLKEILATALHDLSINLRLNGELEKGDNSAREAGELFTQAGNLNLLADHYNQNALVSLLHADLRASSQQVAEANRISLKIDNLWNQAYAYWIQGGIHEALGEWPLAQSNWEKSIQIGKEAGFLMSLTVVKLQLGQLLRQLGQIQQSLHLHQEALEISLQRAPFLLQQVESQLAMDWFALGKPETGKQFVQRASNREKMGSIGSGLCLPYLAMAYVALAQYSGEWKEALLVLQTSIEDAARRKLKMHELLLRFEQARALVALYAVDRAQKQLAHLADEAKRYELKSLEWKIQQIQI